MILVGCDIPQSPLRLSIWVVVVLVETRGSYVLGPTVPWCARVGSMQMDGRISSIRVCESHHCFSSSSHTKSWSRNYTIVANKRSRAHTRLNGILRIISQDLITFEKCWVGQSYNLLRELTDIDLKGVDGLARLVREVRQRLCQRRDLQRGRVEWIAET